VVEVSGEERKARRSSASKGEAEAQLASGNVFAFWTSEITCGAESAVNSWWSDSGMQFCVIALIGASS
jgi:hypothetical protein